ncbi:MAG TPA: hypothetical protein VJT49_14870 [Amycolatopsis sp.]|uniref:DUF7620 family protein n=1 Tax=Amycolatopsis sp. TaxID=37632 RepID=UPI002B465F5F|nr:hypothetical protein [Amycolatopsis sp.]HKS46361.1 hypothetical protein [Amycolatopsis sp.]
MRWWPFRKTHQIPDLDERVRQAQAELAEVREMRAETDRLADQMDRHLQENHFAERFTRAWIARKGRRA